MADEIVVETTRRNLILRFKDANGPINITGAQQLKLQGKSGDIATQINVNATATDPAQGEATVASYGALVTQANLSGKSRARFLLKGYLKDSSGKDDYGPEFELDYLDKPI